MKSVPAGCGSFSADCLIGRYYATGFIHTESPTEMRLRLPLSNPGRIALPVLAEISFMSDAPHRIPAGF
jgi:hypothetical protein